ncbi:hypothetical protein B0T10DRAFT_494742 [Thelonectria olida]|uniref:PD-(D/E)XK nuclease-like domain-containing protein n=1 Tax=Thelonectria olida TaxID=1576542 RepID=A0A9P9ANL2_9HYPO|nr:hypothetical protein B0T10DRAFT_494742 [Thelonectria olida]
MGSQAEHSTRIENWVNETLKTNLSLYCWESFQETPGHIRPPKGCMPTPPSSDLNMQREESPSKKRRIDNDVFETPTTDTRLEPYDIDRTPRSNTSNEVNFPYRLANTSRFSTNPSSTTSSARHSTSSSRTQRSRSPTKRTQNLQALEKPIRYVALKDNATDQLPTDVQLLYNRIYDITVEHDAIFPHYARKEISDAIRRTKKDSWFYRERTSEEGKVQKVDEHVARSRALAELQTLKDIESEAHDCLYLGRAEAAWNLDVHGPLLKLALAQHHCVKKELVTTARIASPFLPPMSIRGNSVESKMIDLVLVLGFDDETSDSDKRLAELIREKVWSQPGDKQFVNQTQYPPLQFRPVAVSIETKAAGSAEEGRLQLGVWTTAWHQRMNDFFDSGSTKPRERAKPSIVTMPLLLIVEHDWKLFFACDRGDRLEIVGEMSVGDTSTLIGLYTIVAVLRQLADWVDSTFRNWIIDALDLPEP